MILLCIQLGGIGIMTIAGLVAVSAGRASLEQQSHYVEMLEVDSLGELRRMLRAVVFGTALIEAIGVVLLFPMFVGDPRVGGASPLWMAVFHAIAAFCNAGMSLFTGNLIGFADAPGIQLVLMALTILGGLGFPVLIELTRWGWRRLRLRRTGRAPAAVRLSVHTRVVCVTSALLVVVGAVMLIVLEWGRAMEALGPLQTVMNAFFMSTVSRSSGFNTVDLALCRDATLVFLCLLMFIGGSPASTAGGIKTTTAAALAATLRGELLRRPPELFLRALPAEVVRRAGAVLTLSGSVVLGSAFLLSLTETASFPTVLVEATSAFGTVGLSTGLTPKLSALGKLVLILTMFVGRVGPFTIALAAGTAERPLDVRLAEERLIVG